MTGAYRAALEEAWKAILKIDLEAQAANAGASVDERGLQMDVLGRRCTVDPQGLRLTIGGEDPGAVVSIVVLHYLAGATGMRPSGRTVSYRQLPGGSVFYPAFKGRVINTIGKMHDQDPGAVKEALEGMGAVRDKGGDAAFKVPVFPRLPVTIILWSGDDEIPGAASVLFDETAALFLHVEDLAEVGTLIAHRIRQHLAGNR